MAGLGLQGHLYWIGQGHHLASCAPGCVLGLQATEGGTMTESLPPGVYSLVFSELQRCGRREDTPKEMHGKYSLFDSDTGQGERCTGKGAVRGARAQRGWEGCEG